MSNNESFIDEVTEEVRRERLFGYLKRYGWIGIAGVIALVGGAAYFEWDKSVKRADAEVYGDALLAAMDAPDAVARQKALAAVEGTGDRAALKMLLAAGEAFASKDAAARSEALAGLKAVAEDGSVSPVWRDLASLRWLIAPGAGHEPAARQAGLEALAAPGRAFRPLALEQLAFDKVAAGEREAALADFRALQASTEAPTGLRSRAGQMIVILGGEAPPSAQN